AGDRRSRQEGHFTCTQERSVGTQFACRLLSTGALHRDVGEFVDLGMRESYLEPDGNASKIALMEEHAFLTFQALHRTDETERPAVHATLAKKHKKLTLRDWHDILGHINPSTVKHVEKRGLIHTPDSTVALQMHCSVCAISANQKCSSMVGKDAA
ncbi:unnamed protein product, partial [Discosporangium mesarthrocarpum]